MEENRNLISQLNPQFNDWRIYVWCVRLWCTYYSDEPTMKKYLELLFQDYQNNLIQASVPSSLFYKFESMIEESNFYHLSKAYVVENYEDCIVVSHAFHLLFQTYTCLKISVTLFSISRYGFKFMDFTEIHNAPNIPKRLIDVIGEIIFCNSPMTLDPSNRRLIAALRDTRGNIMHITLFNSMIDTLSHLWELNRSKGPVIIILQYASLKNYAGVLFFLIKNTKIESLLHGHCDFFKPRQDIIIHVPWRADSQITLSVLLFLSKKMAPGGGACKEPIYSHSNYANYEKSTTKDETTSNISKINSVIVDEKHDVHELIQFHTCANSLYPPTYQCPNGHFLCVSCKRIQKPCTTCRSKLRNIRCLALEKMAESFQLPCRYQSLGCNDMFPYYGKAKHEKWCSFRPYSCPYASSECCVSGDVPFLVAHLQEDHSVDMHNGCTFNHRYVKPNPHEVEDAIWMLTVFNCFGRQFCLHFESFLLGTTPVYMAFVRFTGEDNEAKLFSYTLEVGSLGRKLAWQGIPRSIRDGHREVRDSEDGLIIPRDLALFFSGGNGHELKLRVTGRIWKV